MCTLTHLHYKTFYLSEYLLDPLSFPLTLFPPASPSLPQRLLESRRLLVCVYIYITAGSFKKLCAGGGERPRTPSWSWPLATTPSLSYSGRTHAVMTRKRREYA